MEANKVKRRDFLKVAGITGAFFAVGFESFALTGGKAELKTLMAEDFINGVPMNPFVIIPEELQISISEFKLRLEKLKATKSLSSLLYFDFNN